MLPGGRMQKGQQLINSVFLSVFACCLTAAQASAAVKHPFSFPPGEKAVYQVTYFGATAGILEVETLPSSASSGREHSSFEALVRSDSIFSLFYRLKNVYQTSVDSETGAPLRFEAKLDESRQNGVTLQEFDQANHKVHFLDEREHSRKGKIHKEFVKEIAPDTQDVVSTLFYVRALPLEKGKSFDIPIFVGEESYRARVEVTGEEELPTKIGNIPSYVIKPSLVSADGKVKEIPETQIWIGKENDHPLLKVKAKVKVGSIIAYLMNYQSGRPDGPATAGR
jgi:Protein of unknown function (DUF3108)